MQIDFHTHAVLSKTIDFSLENFLDLIAEARSEGLTAIALTEHFNTLRFFEMYNTLDKTFEYNDDYYDVEGFKVFPGMEVEIKEGGHILLVANRVSLRRIREQLNGCESEEEFISAPQLFEMIKVYEVLKIGAHPFRESNPLTRLGDKILSEFDAFDLNGKDLNTYGLAKMTAKVHEFANRYGAAVVTGSDTHHPLQIGCVVNEFNAECNTIAALRNQIKLRAYSRHISPCLQVKVRAAIMVKTLLREKFGL